MLLVTLIILPLVIGCSSPEVTEEPALTEYWPTESWRTSTPEKQGMDAARLNQIVDYVNAENLPMHSVLVIRHGYIVLEEYWGIYKESIPHVCHSVTKSFTSALIGIAMKEGYIESLEQKMVEFFPERTIQNLDSWKQDITLEDMLTMRTGIEWDELSYSYTDPRNTYIECSRSNDMVQFVLDREMAAEPGQVWNYNTGVSHLLSAIILESTSYDTFDFATKFLFEPLGIKDAYWEHDRQGLTYGGSGLVLTPREMAKFGLLYLKNGAWNGEQIVPAEYVAASVRTYSSFSPEEGYGYHWLTFPALRTYAALGLYGQIIGVSPELDLVVVLTAGLPEGEGEEEYSQILYYIMEACE